MTGRVPRVLSIAGTDPTGGAGIQADLKSIAANGGYGMAVVTALVAQNTHGVRSVHVPPPAFLREQLDAVSDDVAIDAVKIGMLADAHVIGTVREWLSRVRPPVVVLDPVMIATSGDRLLDAAAEAALRELLPLADLITPNLPELAVLAEETVASDWPAALAQAHRVSARYGVIVLAKGGHLGDGEFVPDALVDAAGAVDGRPGHEVVEFTSPRVHTRNTHGTGCSLSSAIATIRARPASWTETLALAKHWLADALARADELEVGSGHGPVNHFAGLWERGGIDTPQAAAELAGDWWASIADIRRAIDDLPFVRGLGDGSLDDAAFRWYLAQDALYLRDYSRALSEAARLAPTAEEQTFWTASAHGSLVAELELHERWLGSGTVFDASPAPATTAYVDHLLAAAARGDYPVLVAALLPCFWIYQDVGERLHTLSGPDHPYASWLDTYADPAFEALNLRAIEIVMTTARSLPQERRRAVFEAFRTSAEHERAFFAAPLLPQARHSPST